MGFQIKPATRVGVIPLIDLYSESGCGKTMSSLLLARGLAGPNGKLTMIDTESRRGSLYADVIPGGYDVIDLEAPFSPARYIDALTVAFESKPACVVVDSMSHEWEGPGSVCDMAAENEASGKPGLHNWKKPKFEHAKLVQFLLRSPVPVICCIRAKFKTRQVKDQNGRTQIVKDNETSPIQAEDFIFEATAHAEILQDHSVRLTKCSHPSLRKCFPEKGALTVEHGQAIAKWCTAPVGSSAPTPPAKKTRNDLLKELRDVTASEHGWRPEHGSAAWQVAKAVLQTWVTDELGIDTMIDHQTESQLEETIKRADEKIRGNQEVGLQ